MTTRLRVLTLNVQNTDGGAHADAVINGALRRLEPDVVCLQEVAGSDQLDGLLDGTGLRGTHQEEVLGYEMPYADEYGGTAVASRLPHRVVTTLDQRVLDAPDVPWCTVAAAVTVPDLGDLLVIATTFSWRLDAEAARERQALAVADLDDRHRGNLPTVIAGDLNAAPDAASVRFLTGRQSLAGRSVAYHDAWAVAGDGPGHTWSTDRPRAADEIAAIVRQPHHHRRLDYVLVGSWHAHPDARAEVSSVHLVGDGDSGGEQWPSDHLGVCADLELSVDSSSA